MKRIVCFIAIVIATVQVLMAAPVDPNKAKKIAENFWNINSHSVVEMVDVSAQHKYTNLYFFEPKGKLGFVVVAADDVAHPIQGYSFDNTLGDTINPEADYWLRRIDKDIDYAISHDYKAKQAEQWAQLENGIATPDNAATPMVGPYIATHWNQSPLYNDRCPVNSLNSSGKVYAGCVAIAVAQVMKYWNWPEVGTGSSSYTPPTDNGTSYGLLSANFGSTHYDWANMPAQLKSTSSSKEIDAVATLIYHVGVGVEMQYGYNGSGAWGYLGPQWYNYYPTADSALKGFFGYKRSLHGCERDNYSNSSWVQLVKSELNAGRPLYYDGADNSRRSGHAFVCDGYDNTNHFHFNWGWGGSCDGYFSLDTLAPRGIGQAGAGSSVYNDDQGVLVGVEPPDVLRLSAYQYTPNSDGGTLAVTVASQSTNSSSWTATSNDPWVTLTNATGAGSGATATFTLTVAPNSTGSWRQGTVRVTQGTSTRQIHITQMSCTEDEMCPLSLTLSNNSATGWKGAELRVASSTGCDYGRYSLNGSNSIATQTGVCPHDTIELH